MRALTSSVFALLLAWSGAAWSQTNANATATQDTAVQQDSLSQSISAVDVQALAVSPGGGSGAQNVKTTVKNVPDVATPGLGPAGTSPCLIATSAGVGVTGLGIALGTGHVDEGCEQRNTAALLGNLGYKDAARAYLCGIDQNIQAAFKAINQPCPADAPQEDTITWNQPARIMPSQPIKVDPVINQQELDQAKARFLLESWHQQAAASERPASYVIE